jgi:hypothetical protein
MDTLITAGDHRHERMSMKALPGPALEVIETEFFLQLLVCLLANPSRLEVAARVRSSVFAGRLAR